MIVIDKGEIAEQGTHDELLSKNGVYKRPVLPQSLKEWIALWIANTFSEFQVNFFSNKSDITKCQSNLHHNNKDNDTKAIAIPRVFPRKQLS